MRNQKLPVAALVVMVVCLIGLEIHHASKSKLRYTSVYFYNLQTKSLFSAADNLLPPIETASGPDTGVRAYVFTCDGSTNAASRFIAYLEKMTPDGKTAAAVELKNDRSLPAMGFFKDQHPDAILVRSLENETWYSKSSAEGAALIAAGQSSGGCDHPVPCQP